MKTILHSLVPRWIAIFIVGWLTLPLLHSQQVRYQTLFGGDGDTTAFSSVTHDGFTYVTGVTMAPDFPVTTGATFKGDPEGIGDIFVAKLDSDGNLVAATLLGGSDTDFANGIAATDDFGQSPLRLTVSGWTRSTDFPTLDPIQAENAGKSDAIIAQFDSDLNLVFSSYLGGAEDDQFAGLVVRPRFGVDNFVFFGFSNSTDFPFPVPNGQFAQSSKTNPNSSSGLVVTMNGDRTLEMATLLQTAAGSAQNVVLLGGTSGAISEFSTDSVGLTGWTDHPTFFRHASDPVGEGRKIIYNEIDYRTGARRYSRVVGGSGDDIGHSVTRLTDTQALNRVVIVGQTTSPDFPGVADGPGPEYGGETDAVVVVLGPLPSFGAPRPPVSAYLGGSGLDIARSIVASEQSVVDPDGNRRRYALIAGVTASENFPLDANEIPPLQAVYGGGESDGFIGRIDVKAFTAAPGASIEFGHLSYLGGEGTDGFTTLHLVSEDEEEAEVIVAGASTEPDNGVAPGKGVPVKANQKKEKANTTSARIPYREKRTVLGADLSVDFSTLIAHSFSFPAHTPVDIIVVVSNNGPADADEPDVEIALHDGANGLMPLEILEIEYPVGWTGRHFPPGTGGSPFDRINADGPVLGVKRFVEIRIRVRFLQVHPSFVLEAEVDSDTPDPNSGNNMLQRQWSIDPASPQISVRDADGDERIGAETVADIGSVEQGPGSTFAVHTIVNISGLDHPEAGSPLTITGITVGQTFTVEIPQLPITLAPGESVDFTVRLTGDRAPGVYTSEVTVVSNATDNPTASYPVIGEVTEFVPRPKIAIKTITGDPIAPQSTLDFGSVPSSGVQLISSVRVQNVGEGPLFVESIQISDDVRFFVMSVETTFNIAPGAEKTIQLAFDNDLPIGLAGATIRFFSDDPEIPVYVFLLAAEVRVDRPRITVTDSDGNILVPSNETSDLGTITQGGGALVVFHRIINTSGEGGEGGSPLSVMDVAVGPPFTVVHPAPVFIDPAEFREFSIRLPDNLPPGQYTSEVTVTSNDPFRPTATYVIMAEITAPQSAPRIQVFADNPGELQVPIPHIEGVLHLGSTQVDAGDNVARIEIRNVGDSDLVITAINLPPLQGFGTNFEGPITLPPDSAINVTVEHLSAPPVGTITVQLAILTNDPLTPNYLFNVTSTIEPADPSLLVRSNNGTVENRGEVPFAGGETVVGGEDLIESFDLVNVGGMDLIVSSLSISGGMEFLAPPSTPFVIEPESLRNVVVRLRVDSGAGEYESRVTIQSNDPRELYVFDLTAVIRQVLALNVDTVQVREGRFRIAWDEEAVGHVLESTPQLGKNANWTRVPGSPERIEGPGSVDVDTKESGANFYILRKL